MSANGQTEQPRVGDVIVVGGHAVGMERTLGEILEIRGDAGHERYRVRWEDGHESIFQPADGEATIRHYAPPGASAELMRKLTELKVAFEPRRHARTTTAMDEARVLDYAPDHVGKTVVIRTPQGMVRVVIPASERLSLPKLREVLQLDELRFATEDELAAAYPGFELGAVPPFGGQQRDAVVVDCRLEDLDAVIVEAGSHSDSVELAPADLIRITEATVADVVLD